MAKDHYEHGTRAEHVATLRRARQNGVSSVWSGDIARNAYLRENLRFGEREGMLRLTPYELQQESGWMMEWLPHPEWDVDVIDSSEAGAAVSAAAGTRDVD